MKETPSITELQEHIRHLEKENALLRRDFSSVFTGSSVIVPQELKPLFDEAQKTVSEYFTDLAMDPSKGTIEINDQRYVLIRASALSKDFLQTVRNLYADRGEAQAFSIGKNFLFDIAHAIGMNDAKDFHQRMNLTEPIAKLSAGPLHFAYTGWAFVEILPESSPTPDEDFFLIYNHPYSFEADSWKRSGQVSNAPVCIMNAGYSSGWCEESFGIPLTAVEISCIARGDDSCTFVMSPPSKIQQYVEKFTSHTAGSLNKEQQYDIPTFFERKKVEEEMQRSRLLAEESAKSKEDFVANMSHELRTPLGAILGFTELLHKTPLHGEQQEYVEAIRSSGKSLLTIINDVLDLSKLDAGKLAAEELPFRLSGLVQSLRVMLAPKAAEKGLELNVRMDSDLPLVVTGDPMRLTQILVNLTGNAIKFTERGAVSVFCGIGREETENIHVEFVVKDTGIGIPPEKLETIFDRFTQADTDTTRKYGGTGLGLAISRQLIHMLGGDITVNSTVNGGTEFRFEIPLKKFNGTEAIDTERPTAALPSLDLSKKILVVEDNPMNQKLTGIILQNNGLQYLLAENGNEAIEMLKHQHVDIILMDLQMPVMDGFKATCIIREDLKLKTPIIATTAHALTGEKEKCFQMGVNDYLPKPFTESELLQKIAYWSASVSKNNSHKSSARLIDLSFLVRQTKNNRQIIEQMVELFRQQALHETAALKAAITDNNYSAIYKATHLLRNAIGLMGLTPVIGAELLAMEKWAHAAENMEGIRKNFVKIESVCEQAVKELDTADINSLLNPDHAS